MGNRCHCFDTKVKMPMKKNENIDRMRVSFDLDEVLFVCPDNHKTEPALNFPFNKLYKERLRLGTARLIPQLQEQGFEVWIYTSSFRSEKYIRRLFKHYKVKFDGIVNGERHEREVQAGHPDRMPTKLPSRYRISLHIDDESIVATYGRTYGFKVFQLDAQDDDWEAKIIERVHQIRKYEYPEQEERG